ncbi:hypothetical protein N7456_002636 [Penicillium angulare]|uniref:Azaphilone pigments biosynthesis cluster protein L N-terminal domain-containing protein n=1 Tax=Penicillium angulare TaxID=116970 RepID=A0A9W9G8S8_9EURO|nr:hypothetical protein N7456_002636 [Penicillium angulare]
MSDPFSIASGAVGVISLGLQLTGQVVSYCQAYRDYDDDIRRVDSKAQALQFSLNRTCSIMKDALSTDPQIASDLQARILELRTSFQTLHTKIEKYKPVSTSTSVDVRSQLKRMAHPFRKDTLRDIGNDLDSVEQTIQTSLNIYTAQMSANFQRMQVEMFQSLQAMVYYTPVPSSRSHYIS